MSWPDWVVQGYRRHAPESLWRVMAPKWAHEPLSTTGARHHGGRWNRPGTAALYLSEIYSPALPVATAWSEYQQDIGTRIGLLVPYEADLTRVVDLTDNATTNTLGFDPADFSCAWKTIKLAGTPPTWRIADEMTAQGVEAIRVPSAAQPGGINLVVFRFEGRPGSRVFPIDPDSALPVDQASWPAVRGP